MWVERCGDREEGGQSGSLSSIGDRSGIGDGIDANVFGCAITVDHGTVAESAVGAAVHKVAAATVDAIVVGDIAIGGVGQHVILAAPVHAVVASTAEQDGAVGPAVAEAVCGACASDEIECTVAELQFFDVGEGVGAIRGGRSRTGLLGYAARWVEGIGDSRQGPRGDLNTGAREAQ